MPLRMHSSGRGRNYSRGRGLAESILAVAYAGDWPARLWGTLPRARRVQGRHTSLPLLPPGAVPVRVGFVSDLHVGPTTPPALLDAAFAALAAVEPDVLLLGGDYVFLEATAAKAERLVSLIGRVPAAHKLAVLGNHDLWTHHSLLEEALARAGVRLLVNAHVSIAGVTFVGLDDPWTGEVDAVRAFAGVSSASPLVVLCHSPDGLPAARRAVAPSARALYVCGHTHGGQVATPWGPIFVPGRVGKVHPHGSHRVPPFHLHVSRGVGATEVPLRTWAPPEVAVFDLVGR
ncbi:MAG: metallophosphoesterase family protein [Myxococcales bacterium]|nr:metallophosphoesterase family protein [Myxococcales bacterium]